MDDGERMLCALRQVKMRRSGCLLCRFVEC
jgi:hypothetical protein